VCNDEPGQNETENIRQGDAMRLHEGLDDAAVGHADLAELARRRRLKDAPAPGVADNLETLRVGDHHEDAGANVALISGSTQNRPSCQNSNLMEERVIIEVNYFLDGVIKLRVCVHLATK
jgi:hypothetical protein